MEILKRIHQDGSDIWLYREDVAFFGPEDTHIGFGDFIKRHPFYHLERTLFRIYIEVRDGFGVKYNGLWKH